MWSDNETTIDYLNFGVVADACTKLLKNARGTPISIGISGGWGMGKTSLVRMIESRLAQDVREQNKYVVITFNPWLYQDFDSARSALMQLVSDEVLRLAAANDTLHKKAQKLLARVNLLRLAQLSGDAAITLATGVPVGRIGEIVTGIGDFLRGGLSSEKHADAKAAPLFNPASAASMPNEIQLFRNALEELLEELKVTLVVFVDDLDRCLPKTAISTLESIRLLLFLKRSAFVIAADDKFIRSAVRVHFDGADIDEETATNYFDKLIQVPLQVPRLGINEVKAYLAMLLIERATADGKLLESQFDTAKQSVLERLRNSWKGDSVDTAYLQSLVGAENSQLVELMALAEGLASLLSESSNIKANPRLMKRFLNTVYLRSELAQLQGIELDVPALAKWHLLERCNENLASQLASKVTSATDGRVRALFDAELAVNEQKELPEEFKSSREWLLLNPPLGEVDLRPLLHLSRDTATRDFGSDSLTSAGRALRDALVKATSSNSLLTQAIKAVEAGQAKFAMIKAWQIKAPRRLWNKAEDLIPLIEPTKVYPELSETAKTLLKEARLDQIKPVIISQLHSQAWARLILDEWEKSPALEKSAKAAITDAKKSK